MISRCSNGEGGVSPEGVLGLESTAFDVDWSLTVAVERPLSHIRRLDGCLTLSKTSSSSASLLSLRLALPSLLIELVEPPTALLLLLSPLGVLATLGGPRKGMKDFVGDLSGCVGRRSGVGTVAAAETQRFGVPDLSLA